MKKIIVTLSLIASSLVVVQAVITPSITNLEVASSSISISGTSTVSSLTKGYLTSGCSTSLVNSKITLEGSFITLPLATSTAYSIPCDLNQQQVRKASSTTSTDNSTAIKQTVISEIPLEDVRSKVSPAYRTTPVNVPNPLPIAPPVDFPGDTPKPPIIIPEAISLVLSTSTAPKGGSATLGWVAQKATACKSSWSTEKIPTAGTYITPALVSNKKYSITC